MNYLHHNLEFITIEEGEKQLAAACAIRDRMGGVFHYNILMEDCNEIAQKLESLKKEQELTTENAK